MAQRPIEPTESLATGPNTLCTPSKAPSPAAVATRSVAPKLPAAMPPADRRTLSAVESLKASPMDPSEPSPTNLEARPSESGPIAPIDSDTGGYLRNSAAAARLAARAASFVASFAAHAADFALSNPHSDAFFAALAAIQATLALPLTTRGIVSLSTNPAFAMAAPAAIPKATSFGLPV